MIVVLFLLLLLLSVLAPWLGTDTSDDRSEQARPEQGWYPAARHPLTRRDQAAALAALP